MAAETGVLLQPVPRGDMFRAMAEQPAEVADFFPEGGGRGIRVMRRLEQQRMTAFRAYVFVAPVAIGQFLVGVLAEKARECMPHARHREVFAQVVGAASAPPMAGAGLPEHVVVDVMSPHRAREFSQ